VKTTAEKENGKFSKSVMEALAEIYFILVNESNNIPQRKSS